MTIDTIHSEPCLCGEGTFDIDCTETTYMHPSAQDSYSGVIRCSACSKRYVMQGAHRSYRVRLRSEVERAEAFRSQHFEAGRQILAMPEVEALKNELAARMDAIPHKTKKHTLVRSLTHDSQATFSKKYSSARSFIDRELTAPEKINNLMTILNKQPAAVVQKLEEHQANERRELTVQTLREVSTTR